ncbi:retrovirus-related pol polyprotein from transposon TNT 1-94 [Tanacetum coccineum]
MRPFGCPVIILNTIDHLDALTKSMNYKPVVVGNQSNSSAGTKACDDAGKARVETVRVKDYILLPLWTQDPPFSSSSKDSPDVGFKPSREEETKDAEELENKGGNLTEKGERVNHEKDASVNTHSYLTHTLHTLSSQTSLVYYEVTTDYRDGYRLVQKEPKKFVQALKDPSWIEAMQEELLQFKLQEVWTLVELPNGKRATRTKWVFINKKMKRIEAIRLFLAYASFKDFVVYQMDVKSAFLYGKIEEEVYVCHHQGFENPDFPDRENKVAKCKKQTVVVNSTTEAEYVAASSCCGQAKRYNREVQLQALVDGKKIVVTEASICGQGFFRKYKRQGKGHLSGRVNLMFSTMMVQAKQEQGEGSNMPTIIPPSTSQPQRKQRPGKPKRKDTEIPQSSVLVDNVADEAVYKEGDDSLERAMWKTRRGG